MKILGISFGTKNGRNDCMCKEALLGAQEAGAEIEYIHAMDLKINHCTGCNGCVQGQIMGLGIRCSQKDEFEWMMDKMLDADGIFFSVPIFEKGALGLFHTMMDRFGPRTDRGNVMDSKKMAEDRGTTMPDLRYLKEKAVSYIGIGGSDWNQRVEADFRIHAMSPMWTVVNIKTFPWASTIVMDEERKKIIHEMGRELAEAAADPDNIPYKGEPGICSVCHSREFYFEQDNKVTCVVCGIQGKIELTDKGYRFSFEAEELEKAHTSLSGKRIHMSHINSGLAEAGRTMQTKEFKEVKKQYTECIKPILPER